MKKVQIRQVEQKNKETGKKAENEQACKLLT